MVEPGIRPVGRWPGSPSVTARGDHTVATDPSAVRITGVTRIGGPAIG